MPEDMRAEHGSGLRCSCGHEVHEVEEYTVNISYTIANIACHMPHTSLAMGREFVHVAVMCNFVQGVQWTVRLCARSL